MGRPLSNHYFYPIINIYTLLCGLAVKLSALQVVPNIRHLTFSIRHRFYACTYRNLHAADGADATLEGVLFSLKRGGAVMTDFGMGIVFRRTAPGIGVSLVGARLEANARSVPAHVFTLSSSGHTLGTYHHPVADGQRTVVVAAFTRTD